MINIKNQKNKIKGNKNYPNHHVILSKQNSKEQNELSAC